MSENILRQVNCVAIIGAGPSGLVSAKNALENGLKPFVFDQSVTIGGHWALETYVWSGLISDASFYKEAFSDFPWSPESALFPSAIEIQKYLLAYVKKFDLERHIFLKNKVKLIEQVQCGKWSIHATDLVTNKVKCKVFDFLIVATGEHACPRIPIIENADVFRGLKIHSSEFKTNLQKFHSKTVVVVGCSIRGSEISEKLVGNAKQVINVFRRPYIITPRLICFKKEPKIENDQDDFGNYGIIPWDMYFFRRSFVFQNFESKKKHISELFPEQTNKELSHPALYIDMNTLSSSNQLPLLSISNFYNLYVKEKKIIPICSTIKRFESNGILLEDNSFHEIDVIIYCSGYDKSIKRFLKLTQIQFDSMNRKNLLDHSVYKCTFHPNIENAAFVGLSTGTLVFS